MINNYVHHFDLMHSRHVNYINKLQRCTSDPSISVIEEMG